jgi:DNA polymerase III alpha subunit (gram-positive type)
MRKIALCLDKRTQKPIITLYKIAKKYDFLEIRRTGTYRQLLQAQREAPAPAQSDYKKL